MPSEGCTHGSVTMRSSEPGVLRCANLWCSKVVQQQCHHRKINRNTHCCTECQEKMLSVDVEPVYIRSAPNLAICRIPNCDGGPNCQNPSGTYIPDMSKEKLVLVDEKYTYECEKCRNGGVLFTGEQFVLDCGRSHVGVAVDESPSQG